AAWCDPSCDRSAAAPWRRCAAWCRRRSPRSARSPARLDIGRVRAIEEVPEDLGLADQRRDAALLRLVARRVAHDEVDRFLGILSRPRHPPAEVREHLGAHPGIVLLPG